VTSKWLGRLVLIIASGTASFGLAEWIFRWHESRETIRYLGTDRWLVADADLGYKLNPATEAVNSLGIRHDEIALEKPEGLFRLIVLGDSVAWDKFGFVSEIRANFDEVYKGPLEVVNAAIPGYTTFQERTLLERDLLPLTPDLVVLQYCVNDNHHFLHELTESGNWVITQEARQKFMGAGVLGWLGRHSHLFFRFRLRFESMGWAMAGSAPKPDQEFPWNALHGTASAWMDHTWREYETHLRSMQETLAGIGARFAVVAVPMKAQLAKHLLRDHGDYTLKPQRNVREICERLGVPFLDLHPAFLKQDVNLFRDALHLSKEGHKVAARQILAFIQEQHLTDEG